ncbi:MFS transporter [Paenibacillus sp. P26]|nr:MFS transporter [Paenibacillus sp. P26]
MGPGSLLPCLNTMISGSVQREQRGMITSIYNSLRFLGVAAGPPLFGWMMEKSDQLVFITVTILALITLGLVFFLIKPQGKIGGNGGCGRNRPIWYNGGKLRLSRKGGSHHDACFFPLSNFIRFEAANPSLLQLRTAA